jgi:aryl-alcohol dehydrogenase-like predicted oxidoreductase
VRYQTFGRQTGLRVSEFVLGTGNFSAAESSAGLAGSREIFETFVSAGGTTFDTSNFYGNGEAERILGELLGRERDDFVIITKYGGSRQDDIRQGTTGNSRKIMERALNESLQRLNSDYVDIFMPHFPDGLTPMQEILSGLDDLIRAGKIRHGGLSNFPAWRTAGAATRASLNGIRPLVGIETEYSLAERSAERELLPMAEAYGLGVVLYSPLAGGLLTGKYRLGEEGRLSSAGTDSEGDAQRSAVLDAVLAIAEELETGPVQVSLAWLRGRAARATTSLLPIIGPRTPAQLKQYLLSLDLELDESHYHRLDEISAVRLGTPHETVSAALSHGFDGDRGLLDSAHVPVI